MPRKQRFFLPDLPAHIVQRGRSREPVFFGDDDYRAYLGWLKVAADRYECAIHAYVLMTNHVHILATPKTKDGISRMMQYVGRRYVPYINHIHGTSGSLWEGRFKASLVSNDQYLLVCMRYIELNPVRASMVASPNLYQWSSYHANGQGEPDELVTAHEVYRRLANNEQTRRAAYLSLFKAHIPENDLGEIRRAWNTGTPLGNDRFREEVEVKLQLKVGQNRRGRPKRALTP